MAPPGQSRSRVLIVDADALGRRVLVRVLHTKYDVVGADNREAAFEALAAADFDVLLVASAAGRDELLWEIRRRGVVATIIVLDPSPRHPPLHDDAILGLANPFGVDELRQTVELAVAAARQRKHPPTLGKSAASLAQVYGRAMESMWMLYEPVIRARDGALHAYEAVVRTAEPALHDSATMFAAAERLGRVGELTNEVIVRASADTARLGSAATIVVSVPPSVVGDDVQARVRTALPAVVLSLTRPSARDTYHDLREGIRALRHSGYRVAVGDLGSGYAGLTSFTQLEPDVVRIDAELVRDIDVSSAKRSIVASIVRLCKAMHVVVLADGVDTPRMRDAVIGAGCDLLRGRQVGVAGPAFPPHLRGAHDK